MKKGNDGLRNQKGEDIKPRHIGVQSEGTDVMDCKKPVGLELSTEKLEVMMTA